MSEHLTLIARTTTTSTTPAPTPKCRRSVSDVGAGCIASVLYVGLPLVGVSVASGTGAPLAFGATAACIYGGFAFSQDQLEKCEQKREASIRRTP